jgi:plastocyanin
VACALFCALAPATASAATPPPLSVDYTAADISNTNHQWYVTGTTTTASTLASGGVATFHYATGNSRHNVTFTSALKPTCQIAGTTTLNPPYTVPNPARGPGWTASCRFDTAGVYSFVCQIHSTMTGTLDVVGTSAASPVSGTVPATLSLALGNTAAGLGSFALGVDADYTAGLPAAVTSTAGDATLTAADPSATAPGHLVNGDYALAQPLQVRATSAANPATPFAPLSGAASPLLTWHGPVSNDAVTVEFKQPIGATDPLRSGTYAKSIVFTLTTSQP